MNLLTPATDDYSEEELLKLAIFLQTNYNDQLDQDESPVDMAMKLLSNYEKQNVSIAKRLSSLAKMLEEWTFYLEKR